MPTYEYLCQGCEQRFEQFQSITANPLRKCPECGKMKLKRLIGSGAGIIFKGSGFYETDYRSENYKSAQERRRPARAIEKPKIKLKPKIVRATRRPRQKQKPPKNDIRYFMSFAISLKAGCSAVFSNSNNIISTLASAIDSAAILSRAIRLFSRVLDDTPSQITATS